MRLGAEGIVLEAVLADDLARVGAHRANTRHAGVAIGVDEVDGIVVFHEHLPVMAARGGEREAQRGDQDQKFAESRLQSVDLRLARQECQRQARPWKNLIASAGLSTL